jgi:hypothetical protein
VIGPFALRRAPLWNVGSGTFMGNIPLSPTPSCYCSGLGAWAKSPSVHLSFHKFQKSRPQASLTECRISSATRPSATPSPPANQTSLRNPVELSIFGSHFFLPLPSLFFAVVCVWALLACLVEFRGVQATGSAGLTTGFRVRGPVVCLSTA